MAWNGKDADSTVAVERGFELTVDDRMVPGVYWTPAGGTADRLVLLGHGGTTHKKVDYLTQVAHGLAGRGIATMAIDGPGHGDRLIDIPDDDPNRFPKMWHKGGGTDGMLADWRAALDFIESADGSRPTGWWGLSMGTMMGLPVAATDPRIKVAVLGLMGSWGPNGDELMAMASDIDCPVRFLVQWDDEIVPRADCLELFGALATAKKTLHANPGAHAAVPRFEVVASVDYLDRHLGA